MEHQYSILHLKTRNGKATIGLLKKGVVECLMMLYRDEFRPQHTRHTETHTHTCPLPTVGRKEMLIKAVTVFLTSLDI